MKLGTHFPCPIYQKTTKLTMHYGLNTKRCLRNTSFSLVSKHFIPFLIIWVHYILLNCTLLKVKLEGSMQARDPPWLWNSGQASLKVQNRGNHKKDWCHPNSFFKKLNWFGIFRSFHWRNSNTNSIFWRAAEKQMYATDKTEIPTHLLNIERYDQNWFLFIW